MNQRISLSRYLVEQQRVDGLIPAQLRLLLEVVARWTSANASAGDGPCRVFALPLMRKKLLGPIARRKQLSNEE